MAKKLLMEAKDLETEGMSRLQGTLKKTKTQIFGINLDDEEKFH